MRLFPTTSSRASTRTKSEEKPGLRYLVDTHVAVWFVTGDKQLSPTVLDMMLREQAEPFVSIASLWELAIKRGLGKLTANLMMLRETLAEQKFGFLPITLDHAMEAGDLDHHHRDPFDRMLITQAKIEGMTIITHDRAFEPYGVPIVWT